MSTSFEKIKDTEQLQDYLQKHAAGSNVIAAGASKARDASPAANDYMGMKKLKEAKAIADVQLDANSSRSGLGRFRNAPTWRRALSSIASASVGAAESVVEMASRTTSGLGQVVPALFA